MKTLICSLVVLSGCASVATRPDAKATAKISVKGFAASPNTLVTWFFGLFGCGIYWAGYGQTELAADGTFIADWEPKNDDFIPTQFFAFVDANQNGRCDEESEPVFLTNVVDGVADFAAAKPVSIGCMVMNIAQQR